MYHSSRESPKSGGAEGVKGVTADFVRFHCPLVAPEGAIPLASGKIYSDRWIPHLHESKVSKPCHQAKSRIINQR